MRPAGRGDTFLCPPVGPIFHPSSALTAARTERSSVLGGPVIRMISKFSIRLALVALFAGFVAGSKAFAQQVPETVFAYPGDGGKVGEHGRITHDNTGRLHAAYYDSLTGDLKYARGIRDAFTGEVTWTIQRVDTVGDVGLYCAIATNSGGFPAISYHDATNGTLKLAYDYNGDGDFEQDSPVFGVDPGTGYHEIRTVDASSSLTGLYTSIAIDISNNINISYKDAQSGHLRWANVIGLGHVDLETVDTSSAQTGRYSRILVNDGFPYGTPTIFYQDETNLRLMVRRQVSGNWVGIPQAPTAILDSSGQTGFYIDAVYDPVQDYYYVVYQDAVDFNTFRADPRLLAIDNALPAAPSVENLLICANEDIYPCALQNPEADLGYYASIALSGSGLPRIFHYLNSSGDLTYDQRNVAGPPPGGPPPAYTYWSHRRTPETRGNTGNFTSAHQFSYPGPTDIIHVGFHDVSHEAFRLGTVVNDLMTTDTATYIDGAKAGEYSSLVVDPAGVPVAAFYDDVRGSLMITRRDGPAVQPWSTPILIDDSSYARTTYPNDLNADQNPKTSESNFAQTGQRVSMAVDSTGVYHLAYFDRLRRRLFYSTFDFTSGTVVHHSVDNAPGRGEYLEQATDHAGSTFAIAYSQDSPPALRVAVGDGLDTWIVQDVDTTGNVGKHCSICFDSMGGLHVAYQDATNLDLKYAHQPPGGTWTTQTVNPGFNPDGYYNSIAINPRTNRPAISYYDAAEAALKYAELDADGVTWATATVDDIGDVGLYSRLIFDSSGDQINVVYHDAVNGALKVASRQLGAFDPSFWPLPFTVATGGLGIRPSVAISPSGEVLASFYNSDKGDLEYLHVEIPSLNRARTSWTRYP